MASDLTDHDAELLETAAAFDDALPDVLQEHRDYLRQFVIEHFEGPTTEKMQPGRKYHAFDFGDGPAWYLQTTEELPYEADVAICGLNEARLVEIHLGKGGDPEWLMKSSMLLGKVTGILSRSGESDTSDVGRKVLAGIKTAADKRRKLNTPRLQTAVAKRMTKLIGGGMKPITAAKQCEVEFANRRKKGKPFSWRTVHREWKKLDAIKRDE